jgi:hypothetical protein
VNTLLAKWKLWAAVLAVLVIGAIAYERFYAGPYGELSGALEEANAANRAVQQELDGEIKVRKELRAAGERTLGAAEDVVNDRFRTGLYDIASKSGLIGVEVNARPPLKVLNPAGTAKGGVGKLDRELSDALKKQPDFYAIDGDLKGNGTLDQVLRTMAAVRAQPWAHRIGRFEIKPTGRERDRFELNLGVATVFASDLAPKEAKEPVRVALADAAAAAWQTVVAKNMFREPPPPPPPPPQPETKVVVAPPGPLPPPPPPPPPYGDWKLSGVVQGHAGVEAFLVNGKTGEHKSVAVGATVLDAKFVGGEGERAIFEIGGNRFEVSNGQTLAERRAVNG